MAFDLSTTRHALVTGAAGAIGGALARAIATRAPRARLTVVDNDARVEAVARDLGATAVICDLSRCDELPSFYEDATKHGAVDALFNCAGIMELRSFAGTPWSLGNRLLAIDLLSPMRLMSLALPAMRAGRRGLVVNLASMAGLLPIRGSGYYGAAKAGLAMASEIARIEVAPDGVHVMTVYPGPVASGLERHARAQVKSSWVTKMLPMGDATTLAKKIVAASLRGAPRVVYPPLYVAASRAVGVARAFTEHFSPIPNE